MRVKTCSLLPVLLAALGCGDAAQPSVAPTKPAEVKYEPDFGVEPEAIPSDQPGLEDTHRAHLNLLNLAHLADVNQGGLFVDFGTAARHKYTIGNWKTGWGEDGVEGDTTFTYVGKTGHVYLPMEVPGMATLRFRMKAIGTAKLTVYINKEPLPLVRLDKSAGFKEYDLEVPADLIKRGENHVMLRLGGTTKLNAKDVSVAIDYLRVMPASSAPAEGETPKKMPKPPAPLPHYAQLVREVTIDDQRRRSLVMAASSTLTWYLKVPAEALFSFRVGRAEEQGGTATIRLTAVDAEPFELWSGDLKSQWTDQVVSLGMWAGQLLRVDLVSEGPGATAWSSPSILVPHSELSEVQPAKSVIVLLIDTLRADRLRVYNKHSRLKTPVIDVFAAEGTLFEQAQSPENWTKPSVASVLTGLYPMTHGTKKSEAVLPDAALLVSEVFQKSGFVTGTFLANGYVSDKFGFKQGWDHYTNYIRENRNTEAKNVFKEAGDWIEKHKDKRFFAYIQTIDPHVPYDPPAEFLRMYDDQEYGGPVSPRQTPSLLEKAKRNPPKIVFNARDRQRLEALHDGEISYHDKYFGLFIERLKKLGLYDQVFFAITSDHGEEFYEHGSYGHGHSVYQEMLHVPFMFRMPGTVPAGKRIPETVNTLDMAPTILSAAGVAIPEVMEGVDRMGHIRGVPPPGPAVAFSDFLDDRRVIRAGRYKLVLRGLNITLFDLKTDPGEKQELDHRRHPIVMRYCRTLLGQFMGASDRGRWLEPSEGTASSLETEDALMDEKTVRELRALGYVDGPVL